MKLLRCDLDNKNSEQLKNVESEAEFVIESLTSGVQGIGEVMQLIKAGDLSNEALKNLGVALCFMGEVAETAISTQNDIKLKHEEPIS